MSCSLNEILPSLFISDSVTHSTNDFYKKFNIRFIINCTKDLPDISKDILNKYNIEYVRIPINEEASQNNIEIINNDIDIICSKIHNYLMNLSGVLIYCYSGFQSSPTIIASYILKYCGLDDINLTIYYIRTKRPKCFIPRINFYDVLKYVKNNK